MILVAVPAEEGGERRVAITPETAKKFIAKGCDVAIEQGAGLASGYTDADYLAAGARISGDIGAELGKADVVLGINGPSSERIRAIGRGALLAASLNPTDRKQQMQELANAGVAAFAMEFMPRITRAQSMDILSSQSNLAGYKAAVDAAATFTRAMPMMMTAAGTVPAAKVFVMGVGVAGLQAIATARRLGAIVSATDVRPAVKEQVASLGAKFIAVEDEEFKAAETSGGYAKEMSAEYKKKQAELVASHIAKQDIVITTALIPGRPAPKLISRDMVESMARGSLIVDLAAERGGNCELTQPGNIVEHNGVTIMGRTNLAGELPGNASALFARNLLAFMSLMIDDKAKALRVNWEDELVTGTLICRDGALVHPRLIGEGGK